LSQAGPSEEQFHIHMENAQLYGAPSKEFVSGVMNEAVKTLRQTSRSWSFNPRAQ
jgi:hypothetical protein